MQVAFGRVRRRIAPLRTMHLLRKQHLSKRHRLVVRRFIVSVRKSYRIKSSQENSYQLSVVGKKLLIKLALSLLMADSQ